MADIIAFTAEQVARITGLSLRQLYYWDRHPEFFKPEFADASGGRYFGRIYSFRDLVSLRTIAILLRQHGIPLQELRRVDPWLKAHQESPWASLRLYVLGKHVYFEYPGSRAVVGARYPHQMVMPVVIDEVVREVRAASGRLHERTPEQIGQIIRNRYVAQNAFVLAGTRISTGAIWSLHEAGYTPGEIIREYPRLTPADVAAAIAFERENRKAAAS
jgi:uncharacterized protein (DUF433 family)